MLFILSTNSERKRPNIDLDRCRHILGGNKNIFEKLWQPALIRGIVRVTIGMGVYSTPCPYPKCMGVCV